MPISYCKLFEFMKERGITKYKLRKIISPGIVNKISNGGHIDTRTIEKICLFLKCQPGDIMEIIEPEEKES